LYFRIAFWTALFGVTYFAIMPLPVPPEAQPNDKFLHMLAFGTLTILGTLSYRQISPLVLAVTLSAFGAIIETIQSSFTLNRDAEFLDWVADTIAILVALALAHAEKLLFRVKGGPHDGLP